MDLRGGRRRLTSHVETSSMNDIMFFLMLFFLIVSTMVNPNVIKLLLPSAKSSTEMQRQPITVSINEQGEYFVDKTPASPESLEGQIQSKIAGLDQPTVILRVDASLNVQKLVDVLEIGNRLKVRMVMATQDSK